MAILVAALLAPLTAQRPTGVTIDAQVVDADGKPVADAEFADLWNWSAGRFRGAMHADGLANAIPPLRTDAHGRLRGSWLQTPWETPLFGLSPDQRLAAFVVPEAHPPKFEAVVRGTIVLQPAVVLRGNLRTTIAAPSGPLGVTVAFVRQGATESRTWMSFLVEAHDFALPLPPGGYSLGLRFGHGSAPLRTVVLKAGAAEFDVGPVSVPAKPFDLIGEILPDWEVAEATNVPIESATLVHFRGEPLLIAFDEWGARSRTGPTNRQGLLALVRHARRDEFAVVLFDTTCAENRRSPPDDLIAESRFPVIRPETKSAADERYGARFAFVVLDRDGRGQRSRGVGAATALTLPQLWKNVTGPQFATRLPVAWAGLPWW
jgi:hypothetical protein